MRLRSVAPSLPTGPQPRRAASGGGRSGAGLGTTLDAAPLGLVRPDRDCQARRSYAAAVNELSGGTRPVLSWTFWPCISFHRTRVRKASQRFVSLKAFSTEETNQRFRQSSARVPSSNQWIITQPTSRLLILPALKAFCTAQTLAVRSSARETQCGDTKRVWAPLATG